MGIKIILAPKQSMPPYNGIVDKMQVCYEALSFFKEGLFDHELAELWIKAPSEALGGIRRGAWATTNAYEALNFVIERLKKLPTDELMDSIVIFRGNWVFNGISLSGYFSAYNSSSWRNAYGDIEISAYSNQTYEDLVDALWATHDMPTLIPQFLTSFQKGIKKTKFGLSQITFSRGVSTDEDPSNLMAIYLLGERRGLLQTFYKARRKSNDPDITPKSDPLSTSFFLKTIVAEEIVAQRINKRLSDALVVEVKGKSALYIAKTKESFEKLYDEISKSILKPALNKLPKEETVRDRILEGLAEYKEESSDQ